MDMRKKQVFNDVWFFYSKYIDICKDDERWEEIIKEADALVLKHKKDKFAKGLINTVIEELGRVQKG